jgi:hypothetical protein
VICSPRPGVGLIDLRFLDEDAPRYSEGSDRYGRVLIVIHQIAVDADDPRAVQEVEASYYVKRGGRWVEVTDGAIIDDMHDLFDPTIMALAESLAVTYAG